MTEDARGTGEGAPGTPVTVITGGGGGMGLATAGILGEDTFIVVADSSVERLERAGLALGRAGVDHEAIVCDITDRASVVELAARAASFGTIVSLVHTAGISPNMGSPERILRVNALGTATVNQAFVAAAHPGFRIVNVASSAGHLPVPFLTPTHSYPLALTDPDRFVQRLLARTGLVPERRRSGMAYAISKHFVIWLSRELAPELGRRGARIVSVSPGSVDTDMGRLEAAHGAGALARSSALRRFGTVDEVAQVLAFLAGEKAGYLTGTDVLVDGGAQATMTWRDTLAMARGR